MGEEKLIRPGKWFAEFDGNGNSVRVVYDKSFRELLGYESEEEFAANHKSWASGFHPDDAERVNQYMAEGLAKHPEGMDFDIEFRMMTKRGYRWFHDYARCIRSEDGSLLRCDGVAFDIEDNKNMDIQLQHEQLRGEVFKYFADHDDDPIELLKAFAERLRVLIKCDQVIYRDLEETRIMVNSPAIEKTWAVPIEYCQQCQHFDAHHPMYAEGYTEMSNCQEGWQGIPVFAKCPIKSSLTRIVYCDEEVAGYLAIHYVQDYHKFTDYERKTLEEFTRLLSISLSRYKARKESSQLGSIKRTMNMMLSLADNFDPIIVIEPESGAYDWYMRKVTDVVNVTSMTLHGDCLYDNIARDSATIIHPDDREHFRAFFSRENMLKIARTGEAQEGENRWFIEPENRYRWKYNKVVRMVDENGRVLIVCGVMDTTEAKEKEARFKEQQEKLNEQLALSDGLAREYHTVWLVDGFGDHRLHLFRSTGKKTVQRAVQRGLDEPTYDGTMVKYVMDSVHEDDRVRVLEASKFETVQRETPDVGIYVVSYKRYCDDEGHVDYHQMCFAKAVAEDGTVNYILAFRDADKMLREQIAQQRRLEEALSMAQAANRAKTTFLNNMSHDIRTPMNAIIGYTGLASGHIDNKEQVMDYLNKIGQSSNHLLSLINDVLDMSRIESGKMYLDEKPENISDILHTLRDIVHADIRAKQQEFFIDTVNVNDEDVICDKLRLNQVLLNILSNSIKYTPSGGSIYMRITEKAVKPSGYGTYEFSIKDNGMGMTKEFLETIFDPFTRVKSSTVSGIQGTGLGMAITKNIIDMMGGTIDIQSEPGRGTETRITFDFMLKNAHKESIVIPELRSMRGLVVDDDSSTAISLARMVKDVGMRSDWCASGREAVLRAEDAFMNNDPFKVYIIDWLMADMNGIETTRRIRKVVGKDVPIIILTAYDWSDVEEEAKEAGVTAFVSKPLFPSDLTKVLNSCLGKAEEKAKDDTDEYDFSDKKVLLVEDNELNLEIAQAVLEENGFVIDTAGDGDIAVEKMKSAKPGDYDIVLMDIQMPHMDGYEATRQIRALGTEISRIPILAMTANAFEEDRRAALEAGMNEHIAKPINVEVLKQTLARFL